MPDQLFIQRKFQISKDGLNLSDALVLPKEEYESLSEKQIETLKTERFDNHKYNIEHPPIIPEPTKAEKLQVLEQERLELQEKWSQIEGKAITITKTEGGSK